MGGEYGIIPARAGFTRWARSRFRKGADHPRSRGVYPILFTRASVNSGSSPLARGLLWTGAADNVVTRIIPARAGFTTYCDDVAFGRWDHPRSRGVYVGYV